VSLDFFLIHIPVLSSGVHPISNRTRVSLASGAPSLWFQFQRHTVWSGRPSLQPSVPIYLYRARHVSLSRVRSRLLEQIISLCSRVAGKQAAER
jgi:hypothetical protein